MWLRRLPYRTWADAGLGAVAADSGPRTARITFKDKTTKDKNDKNQDSKTAPAQLGCSPILKGAKF
ncbi:hypothetical protein JMUB6875_75700 [Nocardia sp. JMUB6875]